MSEANHQTSNQENEKPPSSTGASKDPSQAHKESDDDFVDVEHDDADMHDLSADKPQTRDLRLQRFGGTAQDPDDDSEDEHDSIANHPLLGMLAGRLGQRQRRGSTHKYDPLHPENQVLSVSNVEDCVSVENAAFPEHERASKEKVGFYRELHSILLHLGLPS